MKQLTLLMLAILILGCDTETPVVEEPVVEEPVVEEPVVEEPPPVVMEEEHAMLMEEEHAMTEDTAPPKIVEGSVHDGDVNVDPEPLNRDGMVFEFTENLRFYAADILLEEKSLGWSPLDVVSVEFKPKGVVGKFASIEPMAHSQLLEHNTEYTIEMYVQDRVCNSTRIRIKFRTKPR